VFVEGSALDQRLPDGLKIAGADGRHIYLRRQFALRDRTAFDFKTRVPGPGGNAVGTEV
jgi:hypothetical protein